MINKLLLFGSILAIVLLLYSNTTATTEQMATTQVVHSSLIAQAKQIDELNNWRSAQPTAEQLQTFILEHQIEVVIRLNGDEVDGSLLLTEEKAICEKLGVQFERINPHLSSTPNGGYDNSGKVVAAFLKDGNVLIHCQHGYDRVGAMAGYWLRHIGDTEKQVISSNGWENYLEEKGEKYIRYYQTVTD